MSLPTHTPLTPDQVAAVDAGHGFAHVEDPKTQRVYLLIEQEQAPALDDEYFRQRLSEGKESIEAGEVSDWDVDEIKAIVHRNHAERPPTS